MTSTGALCLIALCRLLDNLLGTTLLQPHLLLIGLGVAILSSAAPYALEMLALRRLSPATFSILLALAPAIAALTGFVVLQQNLPLAACIGIAATVAASAGATLSKPTLPKIQPPR